MPGITCPPPFILGWWKVGGGAEAGTGVTAWDDGFSPTDKEVLHCLNNQRDCPGVYKAKLHTGPNALSFPKERGPLSHLSPSLKLHLISVSAPKFGPKEGQKKESKNLTLPCLAPNSDASSLTSSVRSLPPGPEGRDGKGGRGGR